MVVADGRRGASSNRVTDGTTSRIARRIVPSGRTWRLPLLFVALSLASPDAASGTTLLEHFEAFWHIPGARELAEKRLGTSGYPILVFLMQLDVTNDGVPELFVGTTWSTSRRGVPWLVYTRQADGRYRPLGFIEFGPGSFLYLPSASVIFTIGSAGGGHADYRYHHIGADGIREVTDQRLYGSTRQNKAAMDVWVRKGRPPVFVTELAALRSRDKSGWRDMDTENVAPVVEGLAQEVTESGDCSAEKYLDGFRNAGCRK